MNPERLKYYHVDVFSDRLLSGNGLTVVFPERELSCDKMLRITQEFKQFETIFIFSGQSDAYPVRIFTVDEELDFAGHPMLGAAAVLHERYFTDEDSAEIILEAAGRRLALRSVRSNGHYKVRMNQGRPEYITGMQAGEISDILSAMKLTEDGLRPGFPIEVVSTGLPYLLLPVTEAALSTAGICSDCFENLLSRIGAKFVYLFEPESLECRTWDNAGLVEDAATGSAAGPLTAYLVKNGFKKAGETILINQGGYAGRPSVIQGYMDTESHEIVIEGDVSFFADGFLSLN